MTVKREFWSGPAGFILATIGLAVGLGSIWKFPYEVGANGGGAFVLFYVIGLVVIVFPLVLAEFVIGRSGRADATRSIAVVAVASGTSPKWAIVGALGVISAFLILSFYSVIGGWAVAYAVETAVEGLPGANPAAVQARFDALLASPARLALYHVIFMAATAAIVGRGVAGGIEEAAKILMPILAVLVVLLGIYSAIEGDLRSTLRFMFSLDAQHLTPRVALEAIGLGFFSIGVGLAIMVNYAAYAHRDIDLRQVAIITVACDTVISFCAGFAVFPIVFAEKLDPSGGPGLMFVTLPLAFARMPFGVWAATGFFVLLIVAALASAISLLEMPVALLVRKWGWSRPRAAVVCAVTCAVAGLATVFSFNIWADWHPFAGSGVLAKATIFELLDDLTSNVLLPIGGFALSVLVGWYMPDKVLTEELTIGPRPRQILRFLLRYVVPAAIAAITLAPLAG